LHLKLANLACYYNRFRKL